MSSSSPATSSNSSQVMGHHEEWPLNTSGSQVTGHYEESTFNSSLSNSDVYHGVEELDQLKFEVAHCKWHLSLYRRALRDAEGGAEAAALQLEMVKEHHRPNCAECDEHQMWVDLAAARKHERDSPQLTSPVLCQHNREVEIQATQNT